MIDADGALDTDELLSLTRPRRRAALRDYDAHELAQARDAKQLWAEIDARRDAREQRRPGESEGEIEQSREEWLAEIESRGGGKVRD